MEGRSPATIPSEKVTLELFHEGDNFGSETRSSSDDFVEQFSLMPSFYQEISQFILEKLRQSVEVKSYVVSKETEWLNKFIDILNQSEANNHSEGALNFQFSSERDMMLNETNKRLQDCQEVGADALEKQGKVEQVLAAPLGQIRIKCADIGIASGPFQTRNQAWKNVISASTKLQKIQMITKKMEHVQNDLEGKFWVEEVKSLVESLDASEKSVAIGFIVEFVFWKSEKPNQMSNVNTELLNAYIGQQDIQQEVFERVREISTSHEERVDAQLILVNTLATMLVRINTADLAFKEMFGEFLSDRMVKVMKHREFQKSHCSLVLEVVEKIGPHLEERLVKKFEKMYELLEFKSQGITGEFQARLLSSLRYWKPSTPNSLDHLPVLTAASESYHSVRQYTVLEHPAVAGIGVHRNPSRQHSDGSIEELRRKMETDLRLKLEEEYRVKEEKRIQEELRCAEARQKEAEMEQLRGELREVKRREEEERKRRELEEESKRKEEERRRILQMEEQENKRRAIEHQNWINQEAERKRKEKEQRTRCTFLKNYTLYLHTRPGRTFSERDLDGKVIGLLFSGSWCMPCQEFVPILNYFYQQVEDNFEVVFISCDNSKEEMNVFMTLLHGRWFNLQFKSQGANMLESHMSVNSIPKLVIIKPNGEVITNEGVAQVQNCTDPVALVNQWKRMI